MKRLLFFSFIMLAGAIYAAPEAAPKPNVIFILTDDLGWGDTGWTWQNARRAGKPRIHTPNIDRLAQSGVTLSNHYCCAPVCAPSRASIITGRVQGACSLRDNCFDQPFTETNTLGTVMRDAGYVTWAIGKWGIAGGGESGKSVTSHPLDRGFDYFYGILDHMAGHTYYHYEGHVRGAFMGITENRTNATESAKGIYSTDLFIAKAKELIGDKLKGQAPGCAGSGDSRPFFMYLAVNTIHGSGFSGDDLKCKEPLHVPGRPYPAEGVAWPLEPEPPEKRNTWIDPQYAGLPPAAARYATAVTRLDNAIGDLARYLAECGIDRDTLIVFTSDNGPADEYGADPRFFGSNGPFDGMKRDVYEGGMRVGTFITWPAKIPAGSVDPTPSQGHAWMNFLAAAAEGRYEPMKSIVYTQYEFPWDGGSEAFREFKARKGDVRGLQQMVRVGDYVALRVRMREGGDKAKIQLYNVVEDPFQSHDLAGDPAHRARLEQMAELLDRR